jgi:hypothetical protein
MKIWFNEFLQNAAFPAVVLAFACSPINNEIPDVRTGRSTDPRRAEKTRISYIDPMKQGRMVPADERPCLKTGSRHLTKLTKGEKLFQLAKLLY